MDSHFAPHNRYQTCKQPNNVSEIAQLLHWGSLGVDGNLSWSPFPFNNGYDPAKPIWPAQGRLSIEAHILPPI